MSKQTYHGSCYCGQAKYDVQLDLETASTGRCNCNSCRKRRWWGTSVPMADFSLGTSKDKLKQISTAGGAGRLYSCTDCGVLVFSAMDAQEWNDGPTVSVNLGTLDDVEPSVLATLPIQYFDGLGDNWMETPAVTAHL